MMDKNTINCQELQKLLEENKDLILLDVRDEEKFLAGTFQANHVKTLNRPYLIMKETQEPVDEPTAQSWKDKPIITFCTSGNKAGKAATLLREHGFHAVSLEGGLTAWKAFESGVEKD
ncbi:rhodanese-like domain-containing protein [Brevibacillus panacihumi]|nr:rhodanese-like domain-containing protein [Brevibacillus panacihumi]